MSVRSKPSQPERRSQGRRRSETASPRFTSRWKQIVFRLLAVSLPLLLIEGGARIYWSVVVFRLRSHQQLFDDMCWERGWMDGIVPYTFPEDSEFTVATTLVHTNNLGLRGDEEVRPGRTEGEGLRILCVGDSVTFGYTVSDNEHTYPAVLERLLRDAGVPCRVINGGMPRFRMDHVVHLYEKLLPEIEPDVVVILGGWNDARDNVLMGPRQFWIDLADSLKEYVYVLRVGLHYRNAFARTRSSAGPPQPAAGFRQEGLAAYEESLRRLVRLCRRHRAAHILCTLPSFFAAAESPEAREKAADFASFGTTADWAELAARLNATVTHVAASEKVPIVDLSQIDDHRLYADAIHPTEEGSARIAREVAEFLRGRLQRK